jgi:hypothetical protein
MQERLDKKDLHILEEKQKRRAAVARQVDRRRAVEQVLDDTEEWVAKLQNEISEEQKRTRAAQKDATTAKKNIKGVEAVSSKRLDLLKDLRLRLRDVKDELIDKSKQRHALEHRQTIQLQIKKERPIGRRGGRSR